MSSIVLFICRLNPVVYILKVYAGLGVKTEQVVLSELNMRWFDLVQAWMMCRYGCMCTFAVCMLMCVAVYCCTLNCR